jgi:hypothetical protein
MYVFLAFPLYPGAGSSLLYLPGSIALLSLFFSFLSLSISLSLLYSTLYFYSYTLLYSLLSYTLFFFYKISPLFFRFLLSLFVFGFLSLFLLLLACFSFLFIPLPLPLSTSILIFFSFLFSLSFLSPCFFPACLFCFLFLIWFSLSLSLLPSTFYLLYLLPPTTYYPPCVRFPCGCC